MQVFAQICNALSLMHDKVQLGKRIVHRDIKSHNIFLMKDGRVKLGDFGIVKVLENTKSKADTVIGTPYYFSPEMCRGDSYDEKTDVWSLGVVLYEMCQLEYPFKGKSIADLTTKITHSKYKGIPDIYSKDVKDLIYGMLKKEPKNRPNIK